MAQLKTGVLRACFPLADLADGMVRSPPGDCAGANMTANFDIVLSAPVESSWARRDKTLGKNVGAARLSRKLLTI